jgi:hypothetical protein
MKLPWVSRAEYDQLRVEHIQSQADLLRERLRREAAERAVDRLEETAGRAAIVVPPLPLAEPSPIARIIREQAQGPDGREDLALARHLRTYASRLRREKKSEDEIVAALVAWQTTELAPGSGS